MKPVKQSAVGKSETPMSHETPASLKGRNLQHCDWLFTRVRPDQAPLTFPEHDQRDLPALEVLLVAEILIGGHQHLEPCLSAKVSSSPFSTRSHPRARASVTV
jgi:hypothetical protein